MNIYKQHLSFKMRILFFLITIFIILFDQYTKYYARSHISLYDVKDFLFFWSWTLSYNQGSAFGFLNNVHSEWVKIFFGVIASIVSITLTFFLLNKHYEKLVGIAISFILGGAIGNLTDRILMGKVTDFILWHYNQHYWPTFNVADSFITIGVILLIITNTFKKNR